MAIFPITANAANILPPAAYTTQVGRTQLLNAVGLERAAASGNSEKTGISLVSGRVGIESRLAFEDHFLNPKMLPLKRANGPRVQ